MREPTVGIFGDAVSGNGGTAMCLSKQNPELARGASRLSRRRSRVWLRRINILTLMAFASTSYRADRLRQEKLDFPIQGSALSRSEFSQAGLEIRWNTYQ